MHFIFSRLFFILLAVGFVPLSLSWNAPWLRYAVLVYDVLLVALALVDYFVSRDLPEELTATRQFNKRLAIGEEAEICLRIENAAPDTFILHIKDEFPLGMKLAGRREAKLTVAGQTTADFFYNLTPPRRGRYEFGTTAVRFLSKFKLVPRANIKSSATRLSSSRSTRDA